MGLPRVIRTLLVFRVKVRDILQLPEMSIRMAVLLAADERHQHLAPSAPAAVAASNLIIKHCIRYSWHKSHRPGIQNALSNQSKAAPNVKNAFFFSCFHSLLQRLSRPLSWEIC